MIKLRVLVEEGQPWSSPCEVGSVGHPCGMTQGGLSGAEPRDNVSRCVALSPGPGTTRELCRVLIAVVAVVILLLLNDFGALLHFSPVLVLLLSAYSPFLWLIRDLGAPT